MACADPGIFVRGGGGVQVRLTKKALTTFFSPQLILQKSNGQFERNLSFSRFQRGSNNFQGVQLLPGGGGSNCFYPIETHITCDFPGGGGPDPLSPSGSALEWEVKIR